MKTYDVDSLDNMDRGLVERMSKLIENTIWRYHRAEVRGLERIPKGPGIYVGNHSGFPYMQDAFLFNHAVLSGRGIEDYPYQLTHDLALKVPYVQEFMVKIGAVRARPENAERLLRAGKKLLLFPGGEIELMRPFRDRNRIVFAGRQGYVRLAMSTGTPLIPVVAAGAHSTLIIIDDMRWLARLIHADKLLKMRVFPLALTIPWGLSLGLIPPYIPFPSRILIEVLEPIRFERSGPEAAEDTEYVASCAKHVEETMQAALDKLAAERKARGWFK